jgi:hypothetical protein
MSHCVGWSAVHHYNLQEHDVSSVPYRTDLYQAHLKISQFLPGMLELLIYFALCSLANFWHVCSPQIAACVTQVVVGTHGKLKNWAQQRILSLDTIQILVRLGGAKYTKLHLWLNSKRRSVQVSIAFASVNCTVKTTMKNKYLKPVSSMNC